MGVDIHIPADEVWSFFQKNRDRCSKEMIAIAENTDTEYAVYLTEDNGYPSFAACKGVGEPEYEEGAISENDCGDTAKRCYVKYLLPAVACDAEDNIACQTAEDAIYEREDELRFALCDFLEIVLREDGDGLEAMDIYGVEMIDEMLDRILECIATEFCLEVYRPTIITDEDTGCELYVEYPYEDYDKEV